MGMCTVLLVNVMCFSVGKRDCSAQVGKTLVNVLTDCVLIRAVIKC